MYKIILFVLLSLTTTVMVHADVLFKQGFEVSPVEQQLPKVNGTFQLPVYPVTNQLDWLMQQFLLNDTSLANINLAR